MSTTPAGRRPRDGGAARAVLAPALLVALLVAWIPLAPEVFVIPAVLVGLVRLVHARRRGERARRELPVLVGLALLGGLAQLGSDRLVSAAPRPPAAAESHGAAAPRDGVANLIANSDLSSLQGWSRAAGAGALATAVEPGFWRLDAIDAASGARLSEIRTPVEARLEAGVPHALTALLRHDGSHLSGAFAVRTSDGALAYPGTTLERLDDGLLRASATLPPFDEPSRVRLLHLVGLDGDWTFLDVGFAQLTRGAEERPYRPYAPRASWFAGVVWWFALTGVLATTAPAVRAALARVGRTPIALGLLAGLAIQTLIVTAAALGPGAARVSGTFADPNLLAHVAVVCPLAIAAVSRAPLRDAALAFALAAVTVWFSGSRSGLVGLVLGGAALVAVLPLTPRRRVALALAAVAALGIGATVAGATGSRFAIALGGDQNVQARLQVLGTALSLSATYPLTGVGHTNVASHYEFAVPEEVGPRYRNAHAHSLVELPASYGWPVAAAFAVAVAALVRRLMARRAAAAVAALLVALALNAADLTLFHTAVFLPIWLAALAAEPTAEGGADGA